MIDQHDEFKPALVNKPLPKPNHELIVLRKHDRVVRSWHQTELPVHQPPHCGGPNLVRPAVVDEDENDVLRPLLRQQIHQDLILRATGRAQQRSSQHANHCGRRSLTIVMLVSLEPAAPAQKKPLILCFR